MKTSILAVTLFIGASLSSLSLAQGNPSISAPGPAKRSTIDDQITDSVTLFRLVDTNLDGRISLAEAQAAGASEANFKKADTNGDNHIDEKEYVIYIAMDNTREHILFTKKP